MTSICTNNMMQLFNYSTVNHKTLLSVDEKIFGFNSVLKLFSFFFVSFSFFLLFFKLFLTASFFIFFSKLYFPAFNCPLFVTRSICTLFIIDHRSHQTILLNVIILVLVLCKTQLKEDKIKFIQLTTKKKFPFLFNFLTVIALTKKNKANIFFTTLKEYHSIYTVEKFAVNRGKSIIKTV